jgi:hypothetical protein
MARKFFNHEQFNFEFQFALGGVHYGAGDLGEMFSTADRIVDGDPDSWCQEWIATGRRVAAIADGCTKGGHNKSARAAYLRAAVYFAVALSAVDGTKDPTALLGRTFAEHRRCFDAYAELLEPPAEKIDIPYEGSSMPGYLFRPSTSDDRRRTLIMNNGSDGPINEHLAAHLGGRGGSRLQRAGLRRPWAAVDAVRAERAVPARLGARDHARSGGEQFWPGQSQQLVEKLPGKKQLVVFTADEGADRHCDPLARSLLEQRMFGWSTRRSAVRRSAARDCLRWHRQCAGAWLGGCP